MHPENVGLHTTTVLGPILVGGGCVINRAYPVWFLPLGRDGVTITSFPAYTWCKTKITAYTKLTVGMCCQIFL